MSGFVGVFAPPGYAPCSSWTFYGSEPQGVCTMEDARFALRGSKKSRQQERMSRVDERERERLKRSVG